MKKDNESNKKKILQVIVILLIIIIFGTIGYCIIDDYPIFDALYMTIITLTTVGYSEIQPLSDGGRLFTMVLLLISFGFYAYCLTLITLIIVEGKLSSFYKNILIKKEIRKMKNHTIVVGYGRNGKQAIAELLLHHKQVVVIDNNPLIQDNIPDNLRWIVGDATQDDVLMRQA